MKYNIEAAIVPGHLRLAVFFGLIAAKLLYLYGVRINDPSLVVVTMPLWIGIAYLVLDAFCLVLATVVVETVCYFIDLGRLFGAWRQRRRERRVLGW